MGSTELNKLPADLPVPVDDGACDHLVGLELPDLDLRLSCPPLRLPTFTAAGMALYQRVTIIAARNVIRRVMYPVFPPDANAADVVAYPRSQGD